MIVLPTIFALATPPGRSGVAIIRLSGSAVPDLMPKILSQTPSPREATVVKLLHPQTKEIIDSIIAIYFQAPNSFTGEDVLELHIHGSRAVISSTLEMLGKQANLRLAEAGEFTKRAFDNNKLDLTAVEGLADLIEAETEAQRKQALRQLQGSLGLLYNGWRGRLIKMLAYLEAYLDFPDEDIPADLNEKISKDITDLTTEMTAHIQDDKKGERLRNGVHIAIVGAPNVGKSSLLNWFAGRDVAIVSDIPGTTRDVLTVHLDLNGYPAILYDTAGLRESDDIIEKEGIVRARKTAESADLRLNILSVDTAKAEDLTAQDPYTLLVLNKIDLKPSAPSEAIPSVIPISLKTGDGLKTLLEEVTKRVESLMPTTGAPIITRARHRQALIATIDALNRFKIAATLDLAAEDLRLASRALGQILGQVDVEELLDIIFADFCIGK